MSGTEEGSSSSSSSSWHLPQDQFSGLDLERDFQNLFPEDSRTIHSGRRRRTDSGSSFDEDEDSDEEASSFVSEFLDNLPPHSSSSSSSNSSSQAKKSSEFRPLGRRPPHLPGTSFLDASSIISDISFHPSPAAPRSREMVQDENQVEESNRLHHHDHRRRDRYDEDSEFQKSRAMSTAEEEGSRFTEDSGRGDGSIQFDLSDILPSQTLQRIQRGHPAASDPSASEDSQDDREQRETEPEHQSAPPVSRKRSRPVAPSRQNHNASPSPGAEQEDSSVSSSSSSSSPSSRKGSPMSSSGAHLSESWGALRTPAFLKGDHQLGSAPQTDFERRLEMVRNAELEMAEVRQSTHAQTFFF